MSALPASLPTGTVTFLRTDVEGSMGHARRLGSGWDDLNAAQVGLIRDAVRSHGGLCVRTEGDAVFAVFAEAQAAASAAIAAQRALADHPWPAEARVLVRMGLHTGEAHLAGDDYGGFDVNRAARIAAVGHGGQIVLSDPTRALVEPSLGDGASLRPLGRHVLRNVPRPEQLFQLDAPGLRTEFPPLRTEAGSAGNVPVRLTTLIGRERELDELRDLLAGGRLLTVTGPGGIGKTTLAVELARRHSADFRDGAWFLALDAVAEADLVAPAVARLFGISDGVGESVVERLARYLAGRQLLLVLDNFEHLLDAATMVPALLRAAPELRIVVTSRAPLHVGGEQEYPVGPLVAAGPGAAGAEMSPAVELFVERARAVLPGWDPGPVLDVVEQICQLVDGLPLGVELAAARVAVLPPEAIRDRLAARLPLPGAGRRDLPARQRTVEGAIAWSYELLDPDRRRLLRELAVFEGGFDIEQVERVVSTSPGEDPLDALLGLADESLVRPASISGPSPEPGTVRFQMLETIRTFGLRELQLGGEEPPTRRRHALAFLALAELAAQHLPSAGQALWLARLGADHGNLHAALRWAIDAGEVEIAQRLSHATWRYWQLAGHLREGRELADAVVAMAPADEPSPGRMWSLMAAGSLAYWQADTPQAQALYRAQLAIARQIGDLSGEADACFNLASTDFIVGDRPAALRHVELARERYEQVGDEVGVARTDWALANLTLTSGGPVEDVIPGLHAAKQRYEAIGDAMYASLAAGTLAFAYQRLGRYEDAFRYGLEALSTSLALRDVSTATITLASAAILLLELGRAEESATVMGAFRELCELHGVRPPAGIGWLIASSNLEERAIATVSSEEYAQAVARGASMSLLDAVSYVEDVFGRTMDGEDQPSRG